MADIRYFSGKTALERITAMDNAEFARRFPGVKGHRYDGVSKMVGSPVGDRAVWNAKAGRWDRTVLPIDRVIEFKRNPSRHVCGPRCLNATGRLCECECGGLHHGAGAFACA